MPITPLHFGPAFVIREVVGPRRFGLGAFALTQVLFDAEPIARIVLELPGELHEATHNPGVGLLYLVIAVLAAWRWERLAGVTGAAFGVSSHLLLDGWYHADVARTLEAWGISIGTLPRHEVIDLACLATLVVGGVVAGYRHHRHTLSHTAEAAARQSESVRPPAGG